MLLTCNKCDTTYRLSESLLKPEGSKVRCSKCRNVYIVHPPSEHDESKPPVKYAENRKFQSEKPTKDNKAHKEMLEFSDNNEINHSLPGMASQPESKDVNQSNIVSDIPVTEDESTKTNKNIEFGFDEDFKNVNNLDNIMEENEGEGRWAELPDLSYLEKMIDNDDLKISRKDPGDNDNIG